MGKRTILIRAMLALAALTAVGAAIACGDDDDKGTATTGATTAADTKEAAAVRADLQAEIASEKSGDADAFLKHVTENWLTNITGASAEDVKADPSIFQNDQAPILGAITVNGDKATARAQFDDPTSKFDYGNSVDIVKDGGVWKLDALHVVSASTVPAASKKVDITLNEYAFGFVRKDMTSKENLVFHVENTGKKNHMIVAIKIPADGDLDAIIASQDLPEGVEELGGIFLFAPGDKADVVVKDKLAPGRYAFLCFATDADDPNHEPHVFKGMKSDFTVE